jgi:hypothetical protein
VCLPDSNFPKAVKAGWNFKLVGNWSDQSAIEPKYGPAVCLPGSTSSKVKAEQIRKHSGNSSDWLGTDIMNGSAPCMPGSTYTKAKAGWNSSKSLGNASLDDDSFMTQPLYSLDDHRSSQTVDLLKVQDRRAIISQSLWKTPPSNWWDNEYEDDYLSASTCFTDGWHS